MPSVARSRLLVPLVVAHALFTVAWAWLRHENFGSTSDLGAYHSVFWNLAFRGTPWNSVERVHQWSSHVELGLLWLVLPYRLLPTPFWLLLSQSAACAASALPIEAIVRRRTGDATLALFAAAAMLCTPQLVLPLIADFHPAVLCTLPIAVIVWGIEVDSRRAVLLGALAAISLREHMGLLLAAAGLAWVLRHGRRRLGEAIALAVFGLGAFAIAIAWVIPAFGSGRSFRYVAQYQQLGGSAGDALSTVVKKPLTILTIPFSGQRKLFPLLLASGGLPLAIVALKALRRAAWPLLLAAPLLAVQLYSDNPDKWSVHAHYGAPIVPLIAATCALALPLLPGRGDLRLYAAAAWLALAMAHTSYELPSVSGPGHPIDLTFRGSPRAAALARAIAQIPRDASVSAQDNVVPHVAERAEAHEWPDGDATDDYILLDREGRARNVAGTNLIYDAVDQLRVDKGFQILVDEAGVILAKRIPR